ncbi:MAG: cupredoxin domain-containing protein [Acidimicrobiales bacterium]
MRGRAAAAALVCMLVLAGCDSERRAISRDDLPEVPGEPTATVDLGDDGFAPSELEVTTQDLVEFTNTGEEDHGIRTASSSIDTGLLFPGESTEVIFDQADRYELFDVADDSLTMTVVVTEATPDG